MLRLNYTGISGDGVIIISITHIVAVRELTCNGIAECRILTVCGIEYTVKESMESVFEMIKQYYA